MAKVADKITDLEFDEIITLKIIEQDEDLNQLFLKRTNLSFSVLYSLSKQNLIGTETRELLENIFNDIILTKEVLISKYKGFINSETTEDKPNDTIAVIDTPKPKKEKKEKLPRRYGKEKILKDIKDQGGKATPLQNAMLRVNDLKNIYVNLSARGIKDMVSGTSLLSDADCRDITSAITIVERKLEEILKRKK